MAQLTKGDKMKLPFTKDCIEELLKDSGMTLYELEKDYESHMNEEEQHDGEFSEDWTKNQ